MRIRPATGLALAWLALGPWPVLAQDRSTIEVLALSPGPGGLPGHKVAAVAADGTVQLQPMELPPPLQGLVAKSEGYYLLLPMTTKPAGVFRVQVKEVGPGGVLSVVSPEAARSLKADDSVLVLRPPMATTAQLKALPEVIPLAGGIPDDSDPGQVAKRAKSVNNLKQIGLAMHNFHSAYNCFPPAVIFGPDGKPWHSWRVLILPFIEQANLFNKYDFGQPWNSEHNLKILDEMPDVYRDPIHDDPRGHVTHYVAITGKAAGPQGAPFASDGPKQGDPKNAPLGQGLGIATFTDGTSNTILVVPADPGRKIPWTKPEDTEIDTRPPGKFAEFGKPDGIPTFYTMNGQKGAAGVAPVLFADGSVRGIAATTNPVVTHALETRNGGEVIAADSIQGDTARPTPPIRVLRIVVEGGKAKASLDDYKP
ncbi:MAG: DUF1559 domain-containing protein [Isosphaeraceae bacterium]